jgi:hypothetical protein
VTPADVADRILDGYDGLAVTSSWGETSFFYNPGRVLPSGVYFCTTKDHDGANDRASNLDRAGVFRFAFGLPAERYEALFGPRPGRPPKGGVVDVDGDFEATGVLGPHPVYAWMGWVQILSPSEAGFDLLLPLLDESYACAAEKFTASVERRRRSGR